MRAAAAATLRIVPRVALTIPRRFRLRLAALLLVAVLLGGAYLFWFRDSSLVQVSDVKVDGLTTSDSRQIRSALTAAARDQSTLHVDAEALRAAVAGNAVVRDIRVTPDFPHGMRIQVIENRPVAVLAGSRVPVAPDGSELRGLSVRGHLPVLRGPAGLAGVAAAAPPALAQRLAYVGRTPRRGVVARLRQGPLVVFGDTSGLRAKWRAATRVLADSQVAGASYVDVSIPGRPVAGGVQMPAPAPAGAPGTAPQVAPPATPDPAPQAGSAPVVPVQPNPQPAP